MLDKFKNTEFTKSVLTLMSGTFISQLIPMLFSPVVSRIYEPSDYALVAGYSSITVMLTIIATGMYDSALMIDKEDKDAINTGAFAILITIVISLISILIFLFLNNSIIKWVGNENLEFWLFLAPLTIFFHGLYQTLNVWNNRKGRYKLLASNKIIMTIITTSATIYFGYLGFKGKGLIMSLLIGQGVSFVLLLTQTVRNDKLLFSFFSWELMIKSAKEHKDFPLYNMPQGFIDGFRESGLIWIISFFFGATSLGSFSFTKNILLRPLQIIGNSVSQVFFQKASEIYNKTNDIYEISKKTFLFLLFLGLPFALFIFVWGENVFSFVFGQKWEEAGRFSKILIFWLLLSFVTSPLGFIPLILKKQKQFFFFTLLTAFVPTFLFYIFGSLGKSIEASMIIYSLSNIFFIIIVIKWIDYIIKRVDPHHIN